MLQELFTSPDFEIPVNLLPTPDLKIVQRVFEGCFPKDENFAGYYRIASPYRECQDFAIVFKPEEVVEDKAIFRQVMNLIKKHYQPKDSEKPLTDFDVLEGFGFAVSISGEINVTQKQISNV